MKIFFLLLILTFSLFANAQKGASSFSIGPSIGLPLNFNDVYNTGFGAGIRFYHGLTQTGSVLGNINFLSFPSKYLYINTSTLTSLKIGYKYLFKSNSLFITGDGGIVFKSRSSFERDLSPGLGIGMGYSLPVGKGFIDIIPSFNAVFLKSSNRTWLDFHFAYRFKTKQH
jgi:hypothetical protein